MFRDEIEDILQISSQTDWIEIRRLILPMILSLRRTLKMCTQCSNGEVKITEKKHSIRHCVIKKTLSQ